MLDCLPWWARCMISYLLCPFVICGVRRMSTAGWPAVGCQGGQTGAMCAVLTCNRGETTLTVVRYDECGRTVLLLRCGIEQHGFRRKLVALYSSPDT